MAYVECTATRPGSFRKHQSRDQRTKSTLRNICHRTSQGGDQITSRSRRKQILFNFKIAESHCLHTPLHTKSAEETDLNRAIDSKGIGRCRKKMDQVHPKQTLYKIRRQSYQTEQEFSSAPAEFKDRQRRHCAMTWKTQECFTAGRNYHSNNIAKRRDFSTLNNRRISQKTMPCWSQSHTFPNSQQGLDTKGAC